MVMAAKTEHLKSVEYAALKVSHHFVFLPWKRPVCLVRQHSASSGTLGNACTRQQGRNAARSTSSQRVPIAVQRGNAAAVLGTVGRWEDPFWG